MISAEIILRRSKISALKPLIESPFFNKVILSKEVDFVTIGVWKYSKMLTLQRVISLISLYSEKV